MILADIFYNIIIFPIEQIISLSFIFVFRISRNIGFSVLGVSFAFSIITLPLYLMVEKIQHAERDIQATMKPKIDVIKSVFFGNERFMRLTAYYRHNGYNPIYSLRSSLSVLVQVPFFIAAYHFLSHLELFHGVSFGPISNLALPDYLFGIGMLKINILPIIMTIINWASSSVYTKGFSVRDKIQLYGMSLVFLVLLYNSPAALVIYWTCNNVFSLGKSIILKTKNPKKISWILATLFCAIVGIYVLFFHDGRLLMRVILFVILVIIPPLPLMYSKLVKITKKYQPIEKFQENNKNINMLVLSLMILFLITGFVIPSSLIATSVQEFSFIEDNKSPFPFIFYTIMQSFGIFVLWPVCLFYIFKRNVKMIMAGVILAAISMVNTFIFPGNYGSLSINFRFSQTVDPNKMTIFVNILAMLLTFIFFMVLIRYFRKILLSILSISVCALLVVGILNCNKIYKEYRTFEQQLAKDNERRDSIDDKVYQFSKTGKNILVIMLDRAISGYIPYIFEEKPELYDFYDGFIWYRNTISFGGHTIFGAPGIYGGYEYTPMEMQKRNNISLKEKHNEALLMLPKILINHNYKVNITDPPYANYSWVPDLSIFFDYQEIKALNIKGKYNNFWLKNHQNIELIDLSEMIKYYLIRFCIFKISPVIFRNYAYDDEKWLGTKEFGNGLNDYIALDVLPEITEVIGEKGNFLNMLANELPHEPMFLQAPLYVPANEITNKGDGPFSLEDDYHVNIASYILLNKWFKFLKENEVYDNTRIIITSDHGYYELENPPSKTILPNTETLDTYTALLLVKDFNSHGKLSIDNDFMTNADVPLIVLDGIIENPVNPWTGKILRAEKENGVNITTSRLWNVDDHPKNVFSINEDEWIHVQKNIYDLTNWY